MSIRRIIRNEHVYIYMSEDDELGPHFLDNQVLEADRRNLINL